MRKRMCVVLALGFGGLLLAGGASAQGLAVSGKIGTLGTGADFSIALTPRLAFRGGVGFHPWEPSREFDDVDFTLDLASPTWIAVADYAITGALRVTGGFVAFGSDHELRANPTEPVTIGDETYQPEDVGTLRGVFKTNNIAPYAGIGLGRIGGRRGLGFALDLGVAFQGAPEAELHASGPLAGQPAFQANLQREAQDIEDDVRPFRSYPVISLALVFGL